MSCPIVLAFSLASELDQDQCSFRSNHGSIVPVGPRPVRTRRAALERSGQVRSRRRCGVSGWCHAQLYLQYRWQVSWAVDPGLSRDNHGSIVPSGPRPVRERRAAPDRSVTYRSRRNYAQFRANTAVVSLSACGMCVRRGRRSIEVPQTAAGATAACEAGVVPNSVCIITGKRAGSPPVLVSGHPRQYCPLFLAICMCMTGGRHPTAVAKTAAGENAA